MAEPKKPAKTKKVTKKTIPSNEATVVNPTTDQKSRSKIPRFLRAIGGYFKGSWFELRQVRWPDRRASWSLTFAVIVFSVFFALIITGLDYVFNFLFKEVLL